MQHDVIIFYIKDDAYKCKTQQQHQKLSHEFARYYNIHWSHKEPSNKKLSFRRVFKYNFSPQGVGILNF